MSPPATWSRPNLITSSIEGGGLLANMGPGRDDEEEIKGGEIRRNGN